jgi:hypothetical protein
MRPAVDAAMSAEIAAVEIVGSETDEGGDWSTALYCQTSSSPVIRIVCSFSRKSSSQCRCPNAS